MPLGLPEDFAERLVFPWDLRDNLLRCAHSIGSGGVELEFLFADHLLDIDRRELRRGGERIALEPQVFDLLVYPVRNRVRVVSKDDLLQAMWGGRIVSESTLTSRI